MPEEFQAIYESGILRPLQPLPLAESEQVTITVRPLRERAAIVGNEDDWLDEEIFMECHAAGEPGIDLGGLREELRSIRGNLSDVVIAERGEY